MKKLTTIVLIALLSMNVQAQTKDSVALTVNKVYEDVKQGLKGLGEALKVGSEHVYTVLVKQQVVNSITLLVVLIIGIIGVIYFSIFISKLGWNSETYYRSDWEHIGGKEAWEKSQQGPKNFIGVIFICFFFIIFFIGIINLNTLITGFVNPEYNAIKEIIEFVK